MTCRAVAARAERGSIPLALLAMLAVSGIVVVLTSTTVAAQRQARHDRNFTTVLFAADAAVEQAKFRLNASSSNSSRIPAVGETVSGAREDCPLLGESWCVAGGTPEVGTFEWYAHRIDGTRTWEILAAGERHGVQRRLRVLVEEQQRFFASAFADTLANFGNNNASRSYNSGRTGTPRWPTGGRRGLIGSNGVVDTGGSSSIVDGIHIYNLAASGTTDPLTKCSGQARLGLVEGEGACSPFARANPPSSPEGTYLQGFQEPRVLYPTAEKLRDDLNACGPGPHPLLTIDSTGVRVTPGTNDNGPAVTVRSVPALQPFRVEPALLPNGQPNPFVGVGRGVAADETNYYCFRRVRIATDTAVVAPQTADHPTGATIPASAAGWTPVATMGNPDDPVMLYVTGNVEIETGRRFNCIACNRPYPSDAVAHPPPSAAALQIYLRRRLETDPRPGFHVGNDARFGGTIHGPGANCGGSGPLSTAGTAADLYGAMVCGTIGGVGQWHFNYDESLEFIGNRVFRVLRWDER